MEVSMAAETKVSVHPRYLPVAFPEVWRNIYNKLDLGDKKTLSRTCASWRDLVPIELHSLLLPEVVKLLLTKHSAQVMMHTREASRILTQEMDHQRQNHPSNFCLPFQKVEMSNKFAEPMNLSNVFSSTEQIQNFLLEMSPHPQNPFPGRSIEFIWDSGRLYRPFWKAAIKLLKRFGNHVHVYRHFMLSLDEDDRYEDYFSTEDWDDFRTLMSTLPNLRELHVVFSHTNMDISTEMRNYIGKTPMPQFSHLETLELGTYLNLESAILGSGLIPKTVKRFERWNIHNRVPEAYFNFPSLEVFSSYLDLNDLRRFGSLERAPPFKEMYLNFFGEHQTVDEIFAALEPFGKTLVSLNLLSEIIVQPNSIKKFVINLPELQILEFQDYQGSFDWLVHLTSLRDLTIRTLSTREPDGENQSDIFRFENQMYKSNIWNMMPSLQSLNFGGKLFERSCLADEARK